MSALQKFAMFQEQKTSFICNYIENPIDGLTPTDTNVLKVSMNTPLYKKSGATTISVLKTEDRFYEIALLRNGELLKKKKQRQPD